MERLPSQVAGCEPAATNVDNGLVDGYKDEIVVLVLIYVTTSMDFIRERQVD